MLQYSVDHWSKKFNNYVGSGTVFTVLQHKSCYDYYDFAKKNRLHLEHNKDINNNSNTYLVSFRKENNRMPILFIQFLQCTLLKKSHISCVGWFFSKSGAKATIICSCASCEIVDAFWKQIQTKMSQPNKHEVMNQCCFNVGPVLQTMGQN